MSEFEKRKNSNQVGRRRLKLPENAKRASVVQFALTDEEVTILKNYTDYLRATGVFHETGEGILRPPTLSSVVRSLFVAALPEIRRVLAADQDS